MNIGLSIISTSTGVAHVTVVLRRPRPSSSPVSPKKSPAPSRVTSRSGASGAARACTTHSPF